MKRRERPDENPGRMRALVRSDGGVRVADTVAPVVQRPDDVVIRVSYAGLCRTDLYAADGRIAVREPRVLGHEFAGWVADAGNGAGVGIGQRVAVMPWIGCGDCATCAGGAATSCSRASMLGLARDGAFADLVSAPARAVFPVPDPLDLRTAAFAEPVCAALAVLRAGIGVGDRVLLAGGNRIASLVERVLRRAGCGTVSVWRPGDGTAPERATYDAVIETGATDEAVLRRLLDAVRPRGTLVLRSRPAAPVSIDVNLAVQREVTLRAVHYGDFQQALDWLADGFDVADLLGASYALDAFADAFADARGERKKCFFEIAPERGRS